MVQAMDDAPSNNYLTEIRIPVVRTINGLIAG